MSGPPSSPPVRVSSEQERQLKNALSPAFGHDSSPSSSFKPRQFSKPRFDLYREDANAFEQRDGFLPTPIPTSEANLQMSSPPPSSPQMVTGPAVKFNDKDSLLSEAKNDYTHEHTGPAIGQMLIVRVPTGGEKVTVGRSSKSSTFALSASNRSASRVHASLSFDASKNNLMIECLGWNGIVVNVPQDNGSDGVSNKTYDVARGQILNIEGADSVTMEIHGDRALVEVINDSHASDITEDENWSLITSSSPVRRKRHHDEKENMLLSESNKKRALHETPESDDVAVKVTGVLISGHKEDTKEKPKQHKEIEIVEAGNKSDDTKPDEDSKEHTTDDVLKNANNECKPEELELNDVEVHSQTIKSDEPEKSEEAASQLIEEISVSSVKCNESAAESKEEITESTTSKAHDMIKETSEVKLSKEDQHKDNEKRLSSKPQSRMASEEPEGSGSKKSRRQFEPITDVQRAELENVIINLIAFSRSSAIPLSSVRKANSTLQSFPKSQVMSIIKDISCIGIIEGAVEDTTARKADDEYYYIPDKDTNEERRRAVQGTRGHRSLRNCRKTSKQYYYRPLQLD